MVVHRQPLLADTFPLSWPWRRARPPRGRAAQVSRIAEEVLGCGPEDRATHTFYCQSGVRTTQLIFGERALFRGCGRRGLWAMSLMPQWLIVKFPVADSQVSTHPFRARC